MTLGGRNDWAYAVQQTSDGGYVVAGTTSSNDGDVVGDDGNGAFWVVKLDGAGQKVWTRTFGGSGYDVARAGKQTSDGGYVVAGTTTSNDGDVVGNHGHEDFWVVKLQDPTPVVLVHGWRDSSAMWTEMASALKESDIPYWTFDYGSYNTQDPTAIAGNLGAFIEEKRRTYRPDLYPNGYDGKIDIVCHSMGAVVSRWYMERLGHGDEVREWIGIAPAHGGSALADKWDELPTPISIVARWWGGPALVQLQTTSGTIQALRTSPRSPSTTYRIIGGWNPTGSILFGKGVLSRTIAKTNSPASITEPLMAI